MSWVVTCDLGVKFSVFTKKTNKLWDPRCINQLAGVCLNHKILCNVCLWSKSEQTELDLLSSLFSSHFLKGDRFISYPKICPEKFNAKSLIFYRKIEENIFKTLNIVNWNSPKFGFKTSNTSEDIIAICLSY